MNNFTLEALLNEVTPLLSGALLRKVYQLSSESFLFLFYNKVEYNLFVKISGICRRIHLVDSKQGQAATPSSFCMLLRKHLQGKRISEISLSSGCVHLKFSIDSGNMQLLLNLSDSNILLLNSQNRILGSLRTPPIRQFSENGEFLLPKATPKMVDPKLPSSDLIEQVATSLKLPKPNSSYDCVNSFLASVYAAIDAPEATQRESDLQLLEKKRKKILKKRLAIEGDLTKLESNTQLHLYGELILSNMHLIKQGDTILECLNWYSPECPQIQIKLDPSLSPVENSEHYFKLSKKAKRGIPLLQQRLKDVDEELSLCELEMQAVQSGEPLTIYNDVESTAPTTSAPRKFNYRGYTILSGRNPIQNDELSLKIAAREDLWFHARGVPGSHVILRKKGNEKIPAEIIVRAATIAAWYSKGRNSSKAAVSMTLAKNVSKKRGFPAGAVTLRTEQVLYVNPTEYEFQVWMEQSGY